MGDSAEPTFEEMKNAPLDHHREYCVCKTVFAVNVYQFYRNFFCCTLCFEAGIGNLAAEEEERFPIPALLGVAQERSSRELHTETGHS